MSKKIFIDGGAHTGESIDLFRSKIDTSNEFTIYSFECHPSLYEILKQYDDDKTITSPKAIWIDNEIHPFYIGETYCSSLNITKTSGRLDKQNPIPVQCIRLSEFITSNFNIEDFIILKLDIEGAEYDVFLDLINTGAINYINVLYGEFHNGRVDPKYTISYKFIMEHLSKIGLRVLNWNAVDNFFEH
jgi:FkbM family methyltransferase